MPTANSQIKTSISRLCQTAYGTARTNSDEFRRIINKTRATFDKDKPLQSDAGYDNGSDMPSEYWAEINGLEAPFDPDFNFGDIGYFLLWILGGYSVSGTGPYVHTFSPQSMNVSRQLPQRTVLKQYGGLRYELGRDIVLSNFILNLAKTGRVTMGAGGRGSGFWEKDPAGYTSPALTEDREYGYNPQAFFRLYESAVGTRQVETATAAGTASSSGNITVTVTAAGLTGSPIAVVVAITSGDTPSVWAAKVRTALIKNKEIFRFFDVGGATTSIVLTTRLRAANDATMNIAIAAGSTGITAAPTSADTTAGVVGVYQNYTCAIESYTLNLQNPENEPGYRQCSSFLISDTPESGVVKSEDLVGTRNYGLDFTARWESGDKTEDWLNLGTKLAMDLAIIGKESGDNSLWITHDRAQIVQSKPIPDAGGGMIGVDGRADLMAGLDGTIGLQAVLVNSVPSYVSGGHTA